ncbi:hypothetical protein GCM10009560_77200 [Nonomuraea longicatena]|uniref:DUF3352 domain-containing protein n=1 Tax=Nonomuraea longicatena TaxID=83682 RepID=A0ABN1RA41_9ACTN
MIGGIAAAAVILLGGGTVFALTSLSGGGTQPHEVLPASAVAYARLDLDPAAGQKVALFQIAQKFTVSKDTFKGDDMHKALFDTFKGLGAGGDIDYAKDIQPWLGDRVGVGVLPPAAGKKEPGIVVAVQVKDEEQAKAGLNKLMGEDKPGLSFREDYALITEDQASADNYAKAGDSLADNTDFSSDFDSLGEPGILSFWTNVGKLSEFSGDLMPSGAAAAQLKSTRMALALRFDSAYAELAGVVSGSQDMGESKPITLGNLPATTAGAVSLSGAGEIVTKQWKELEKSLGQTPGTQQFTQLLDEAKTKYGLQLPGDLATLMGENLTVAVDSQGLGGDQINVGVRAVTDPAKAKAVVDKVLNGMSSGGQAPPLARVEGEGTYTVATNDAYAKKLSEEGGLGDSDSFKTAVPDADSATFGAFVDLNKIESMYTANLQGENKANAEVLRAVGLSGKASGNEGSFSLRVLFD